MWRKIENKPSAKELRKLAKIKPASELAKLFKVNIKTMAKWYKEYGIKTKSRIIPLPCTEKQLRKLSEKMSANQIAIKYNVPARIIRSWYKRLGIKVKSAYHWAKKYNDNCDVFLNEDAVSYYLLGAYMTDGCVSSKANSVSLCSKDKDWLEAIRNLICKDRPLEKDKNSNCWTFKIYEVKIIDWLKSKGCTSRKSLNLKFPKVPKKYLPDFIRGVIDGDGSISYDKYKRTLYKRSGEKYLFDYYSVTCTLTSASESFVNSFMDMLNKKDIGHCVRVRLPGRKSKCKSQIIQSKNPCWTISCGHGSALKLLAWIYYPDHCLSMPRKYKKAKQIFKHYNNQK